MRVLCSALLLSTSHSSLRNNAIGYTHVLTSVCKFGQGVADKCELRQTRISCNGLQQHFPPRRFNTNIEQTTRKPHLLSSENPSTMPPGAGLDAAAIFKLLQQLAEVTDDSLAQDKLETVLAILKYLKSNTEVIEKMNKERVVLASATALTNSLQQLSCGPQASSQAAVCMRHIGKILRTSASTYEIQTGKKTPDLPYQHPRKRTDEEKEVCARQKVLAQAVAATGGQQC